MRPTIRLPDDRNNAGSHLGQPRVIPAAALGMIGVNGFVGKNDESVGADGTLQLKRPITITRIDRCRAVG